MPLGQTVLSFTLGALASIFASGFFEWLKRPILSVQVAPADNKNYGAGHPVAQKARFLQVSVKNREPWLWFRWLSKNAASQCVADITFFHLDGQRVFEEDMPGRWSGWPEPLAMVGHVGRQPIELVNPYYLSSEFRRINIYSDAPRLLDIAVRFDNDPECYGWTTENYNSQPPWKNPKWRLAPNRYLVKVDVRADAVATSACFRLINDTAVGDFRLAPTLPGDPRL
jgi:hypothetical protein